MRADYADNYEKNVIVVGYDTYSTIRLFSLLRFEPTSGLSHVREP